MDSEELREELQALGEELVIREGSDEVEEEPKQDEVLTAECPSRRRRCWSTGGEQL